MILQYATIALRIFERQKLSAFINVMGLSIGFASFSLFLLFAVHEFSYDRFHANGQHIYRVYDWWKFPGRVGAEPSSATPIGPAMKSDLADVENFVRIQGGGERLVRIGGKLLSSKITFADPQIFSVFTFPLIAGQSSEALQDPNSVVITRSKAMQLFGETNIIGKQLEIRDGDEYQPFTVTGVAEDLPPNSTIRFEILGSFDRILNTPIGMQSSNSWSMTLGISVYVQLSAGSSLMNAPDRLASFRKKYFPNEESELQQAGLWNGHGTIPTGYGLQPLSDMHTDVSIDQGAASPRNIFLLVTIAGAVLAIACINFVILSIGRSASRSKEVGIRKISGGGRRQLIIQFLSESLLLTFFSALLGIGLAQALLPVFSELADRSLTFSFQLYPELTVLLLITVTITGVLAGSYPSLVLSGFKPVDVLKKNKLRLAGSNIFTRSLITFQFALSVALVISTIVILRQLSFMQSKNLGFSKERVVMVYAQSTTIYRQFQQLLESHSIVEGVTSSAIGLGAGEGQMGRAYEFGDEKKVVIEYPVDDKFLSVMGMELIAGRNFNPDLSADTTTSIIVNESLVTNALNTTPAQALGMQIQSVREDLNKKTIIGVVKNFHYEDLTHTVRPQLFLQPQDFQPACYFVRLKKVDSESITLLESAWKKLAPDLPFRYNFVDEKFNAFYQSEQRWAKIMGWAGNICIFLACLGLFGLVSLAAVNRTKEIGIRKVLGASVIGITHLLCRDFVMLVLIAIGLAIIPTWYLMNNWLTQFEFKIELTYSTFVLAGLLALVVAIVTCAAQAVKAAMTDPAKSLRSE